jgi:hypothetical protein
MNSRIVGAAFVCLVGVGCQEDGPRFGVVNQCDTAIEVDSNTTDPAWYFIDAGQARKSRTIGKDQDSIEVWIRQSGSDGSPDPIVLMVSSLTEPLDPNVKWSKELVVADDLCPNGN